VRAAIRDPGVRHHIGIAHGSLEGFSPDMDGRYYPMSPKELTGTGVRIWLLGHTHLPFPQAPGESDTIFCAGTPEPDGFDCTHEGTAWVLELTDSGTVKAHRVTTGQLRFLDLRRVVRSRADLEKLERECTGLAAERTLTRLRLSGRTVRDVLSEIGAIRTRLSAALLHFDLRDEELREEITAEAIEREYPVGSFPHILLGSLIREDDQEALQLAHELLQEMRL
jgi:hypothetical protein